jgi:hypothetical protein
MGMLEAMTVGSSSDSLTNEAGSSQCNQSLGIHLVDVRESVVEVKF